MNKQRFMRIATVVMQDERPLPVEINIKEAWFLVSALQLATRHPAMESRQKRHITEIGRQFQNAIVAAHPEAQELLEAGWHSQFDLR